MFSCELSNIKLACVTFCVKKISAITCAAVSLSFYNAFVLSGDKSMLRERIRDFFTAFASLRLLTQEVRGLSRRLDAIAGSSSSVGLATLEKEYRNLVEDVRSIHTQRVELFGKKRFSQNDEDGILDEIFRRVGSPGRIFVEFGVEAGTENNTVSLLLQGWRGLWIDGNPASFNRQKEIFRDKVGSGDLICLNSMLTRENIDSVIESAGLPHEIDLLSIDVDGNDLHLWGAIRCLKPRVVVIEYNAGVVPPNSWCNPYKADFFWDGKSSIFGASLQAIVDFGLVAGYELVGCNLSGLNAFLVRADLVSNHFPYSRSAQDLYHPRRHWLDAVFRRNTSEFFERAVAGFQENDWSRLFSGSSGTPRVVELR